MSKPTPDHPQPSPSADTRRQVVLVKGAQRWVFRYAPGDEVRLLGDLARLAEDPASGLTWFDAAVLSHQMGQRLSRQLESILQDRP